MKRIGLATLMTLVVALVLGFCVTVCSLAPFSKRVRQYKMEHEIEVDLFRGWGSRLGSLCLLVLYPLAMICPPVARWVSRHQDS
jgi:hypothetical protein